MQTSNLAQTKTNNHLESAKKLFIDKIYNNGLKDFIIESNYRDILFEVSDIYIRCLYLGDGFKFSINKKHFHLELICLFDNDEIEAYQYRGDFADLFTIIKVIADYIENNPKEFEQKFYFEYERKKQHLI